MAKLSGFIVTLDKDVNEDQAALIKYCMCMIKGIADVKLVEADHLTESIARMSLKNELRQKLIDCIKENLA